MSMPLCGTFHYQGLVPRGDQCHAWILEDVSGADPAPAALDEFADRRLIGLRPRLTIAGRRLTLEATDGARATLPKVSFDFDEVLLHQLRPGDDLALVRDSAAEVGLSVRRGDRLLFAVGALPVLPLDTNTALTVAWPAGDWRLFERGEVTLSVGGTTQILAVRQDVEVNGVRACLIRPPQGSFLGTSGWGAMCSDALPLPSVKRAAERLELRMVDDVEVLEPGAGQTAWSRLRNLFGSSWLRPRSRQQSEG